MASNSSIESSGSIDNIEMKIPKINKSMQTPFDKYEEKHTSNFRTIDDEVDKTIIQQRTQVLNPSPLNRRKPVFDSRRFQTTSKRKMKTKSAQLQNWMNIIKFTKNVAKGMVLRYRKEKNMKNTKNLPGLHYKIIGDKSAPSVDDKIEGTQRQSKPYLYLARCLESFSNSVNIIPTFSSNSLLRILWDIFVMSLLLLRIMLYSVQRCFVVSLALAWLDYGLIGVFLVDVCIKLNTRFYINGNQIDEREKIIKHFIKSKLIYEILPITIFTASRLLNLNESLIDINLILCFKFAEAREVLGKIKDALSINELLNSLFDLFHLIFKNLLWAHTIACLWHYIGFTMSKESSWLQAKDIINEQWNVRYLYSIYWGVTTMLTVGYGDIAPTNELEIFFNIWAMVIGCGLFGYTMNRIGEILKNYGMHKRIQREAMIRVTKILRRKGLPLETEMKVKNYLEFVWQREREEDPDFEKMILSKLSSNLKKEVSFETNVKYLKSVSSFKYFSTDALLALGNNMEKVRFSPEENVYKSGDSKDLSLYFVIEGNLEMVCNNNDEMGPYFPIKQFKEKFSQMKDQNLLYAERSFFNIKCDCCGFQDHYLVDCPSIKYVPDRSKIVYKHILKKKNRKKKYNRKTNTKYHPLKMLTEYQSLLSEFHSNYLEDSDFTGLANFYEALWSSEKSIDEFANSPHPCHDFDRSRSSFLFRRQASERSQPHGKKGNDIEKNICLLGRSNQVTEQNILGDGARNENEEKLYDKLGDPSKTSTEKPKYLNNNKFLPWNQDKFTFSNKDIELASRRAELSPTSKTRNSPKSIHKLTPKIEERQNMDTIKSWRLYFEKGNFENVIRRYRVLIKKKSFHNIFTANMTLE